MKYTKLMHVLHSYVGNFEPIIFFFSNGLIFKTTQSIGVFETVNGKDYDDPLFYEYYARAFTIVAILQYPDKRTQNPRYGEVKVGSLFEVSELNEPCKIEDNKGNIIWEKKD